MRSLSPLGMIGLGFILVLLGFVIPLLMVIDVIQAGFLLAFLGYAASMAGLMLGLIGTALYARERRQ